MEKPGRQEIKQINNNNDEDMFLNSHIESDLEQEPLSNKFNLAKDANEVDFNQKLKSI